MVNLGFTQREGELIAEEMVGKAHPHVTTKEGDGIHMELKAWAQAGRPFVLSVVARLGNYTGVLDTGYGKMFLIDTSTGEVYHALNHIAHLNNCVFLDKEYYGTKSWLFISDEVEEHAKELGDLLDLIQDRKLGEAELKLAELQAKIPNHIEVQKASLLLRKEKTRATLHANNDADSAGLAQD